MKYFTKAYCTHCLTTQDIHTKNECYFCNSCKREIEHPECYSKSSYELIKDINTKKKIPWWGYFVLLFMITYFIIELCIISIGPVYRAYQITNKSQKFYKEWKSSTELPKLPLPTQGGQ